MTLKALRSASTVFVIVAGRIALFLLALAATLWLVFGVAIPASTEVTNGFAAYYTASRLIREGVSASRFYDDDWFLAQTIRLGFGRARDIYNLNPPTAALILWPLADLDPVRAKQVWTWTNLVFLGLACLALAASEPGGQRIRKLALALAFVGSFEPVAEQVRLGQAYALLLVIEAGFVWALGRKSDLAAGAALAIMVALKTAGLAFPALLAIRRRWIVLTGTVLGIAAVVGVTSAVLGGSAWTAYASALADAGSHREIAVTAYQSVPGFLAHLFRFDHEWNRAPLADVPWIVLPVTVVSCTGMIGLTAWRCWTPQSGGGPEPAALAAWAMLSIILNPAAADYHYALAIVPAFLLLSKSTKQPVDRATLGLVSIGIVLIGAPWPQRLFSMTDGPAALLAYPRLYGGLMLWALALRQPGRAPGDAHGARGLVGGGDRIGSG
jgi:hypothetical protein